MSMDGRGRALDNVFIERLWRRVKYEEVYVKDYATPREAMQGLATFFVRYNERRQHQALDYRTPAAIYFNSSVSMVQTKSGGDSAVCPEFVIAGMIFHPSR